MPRKDFKDDEKAQIYELDRATCVFSGRSLWNLDYGASPFSTHWDWADHLKPRSRGGAAAIENGRCVSSLFNMKKRANGADNFVLLDRDYKGTDYFGSVSSELRDQLFRLAAIQKGDWYFNRAVCHLIWACYLTWSRRGYKRKPSKYRNSALKKLEFFRSLGGNRKSLEQRNLVLHQDSEDVELLLSMIEIQKMSEFDRKLSRLKAIYAENANAMHAFWNAADLAGMRKAAAKMEKNKAITPTVRQAIRTHLDFWENDPRIA